MTPRPRHILPCLLPCRTVTRHRPADLVAVAAVVVVMLVVVAVVVGGGCGG